MKKVLFIFLFLSFQWTIAQPKDFVSENEKHRKEINKYFFKRDKTPLKPEDLFGFKGLNYFPIDAAYYVEAKFIRTPAESPFLMKTTTGRKPVYVKYGYAEFELQEKKFKLNIYLNIDFQATVEEKHTLFVPFTDLTNGEETYGGGRYLDVENPIGNKVILDFNRAYNPYCAYNEKYSCPIPPSENDLKVAIRAGVKKYK